MLPKKRVRSDIPDFVPRPRIYYNPLKHSLASLPYHILVSILAYAASTPETVHGWPNTPFLLSCATLCRTLHDPTIAVLYSNPPTLPSARAHRLLQTLRARPELGQKIKRTVVEIDPLLTTKFGGVAWDVCEFVLLAKGLRDLQFAHSIDNPPYHKSPRMKLGWRYPDALWDALEGKGPENESEGVRLRSWKWNGMFIGKLSYADIHRLNQSRSFSGLTSLSLIYFDTLDCGNGAGNGEAEKDIAGLMALLPGLRDIKLECSSVVNRKLLSLIATSESAARLKLRELRFINCPLLEAEEYTECEGSTYTFKSFLQSPICRTLKVLEVLQCRACPLSFTTALWATPELEIFAFDGHLFNTSSYSRSTNAEPAYDSLLPLGHVPVWPKALQSVTATSLRKWTSSECIAFLSSLVEAAPGMTRLKRLEIWSMLTDIDWRERAEFREKWIGVVKSAFEGAENVEARFDNARPAEQLWKEGDFLKEVSVFTNRPRAKARGVGARGGGSGSRRATRGGGTARGRGKHTISSVGKRKSDEDEEYVD